MLERLKDYIRRILREKGGFNTLDVTAAMGITASLAAITVPALMGAMDAGKINATVDEIKNIRGALLKFFADTKSLPIVNTSSDSDGDTTTGVGGVNTLNGIPGESSGLRVNGLPGGLKGWNGPYIERPLAENQFGGTYGLDYALSLDVRGTGSVNNIGDPAFFLTNIKAEAQRIIDERLDDGKPDSGFIQVVWRHGGGVSGTFDESKDLVVVFFEDRQTDNGP